MFVSHEGKESFLCHRDRPGNRCRRNSAIRAKRAPQGPNFPGRPGPRTVFRLVCAKDVPLRKDALRAPSIRKCHKMRQICNIPTPAIKAGNYANSLMWKTISHRLRNYAALWPEPSPHVILCASPAPFLGAPGHRAGGTRATPYPAATRRDQTNRRVPRSRRSRVALAFASRW